MSCKDIISLTFCSAEILTLPKGGQWQKDDKVDRYGARFEYNISRIDLRPNRYFVQCKVQKVQIVKGIHR